MCFILNQPGGALMQNELTTVSTKIPSGSKKFFEAVNRLKNAGPDCNNKFEMANYCCKLCTKANATNCEANATNCEECYVQTIGDLNDPYRKKIEENSSTGMYSSGIYKDKNGQYHYSHPQGSG